MMSWLLLARGLVRDSEIKCDGQVRVQASIKLRISGRPVYMPKCSSTLYQRCGLESTQVTGLMTSNLTERINGLKFILHLKVKDF